MRRDPPHVYTRIAVYRYVHQLTDQEKDLKEDLEEQDRYTGGGGRHPREPAGGRTDGRTRCEDIWGWCVKWASWRSGLLGVLD
ncbi:unnamed protein product [Merluccius merluccius]